MYLHRSLRGSSLPEFIPNLNGASERDGVAIYTYLRCVCARTRAAEEYRKLQRSARAHPHTLAHALAADARSARYILFSYAGETASSLKYRAIPCSPRPRSISTERAHANIICESLAFLSELCERHNGIPHASSRNTA